MPKKKLFHMATNYPAVLGEKILKYMLICIIPNIAATERYICDSYRIPQKNTEIRVNLCNQSADRQVRGRTKSYFELFQQRL